MSNKKTLVLVDGSSYLYRAFFAGGETMSTTLPDGTVQKTGAIRIIINMMNSLRKEVQADYAVCVFDAKGPTFRDEWYPAYKATRSPMPDDLRSQIEPVHEVIRLMGWPVIAVPGVEADDVIGTLARVAGDQGIEVVVSSGDKDLSQLVNEHVTIIDTMNGKRRDVVGVTEEFGVPPSLMVDYQTLVGDTVDNVPGVPKVGPKTAAKWLMEYGSLDALMARATEIKGVAGENLRRGLVAAGPPPGHHQDRLRVGWLYRWSACYGFASVRRTRYGRIGQFLRKIWLQGPGPCTGWRGCRRARNQGGEVCRSGPTCRAWPVR